MLNQVFHFAGVPPRSEPHAPQPHQQLQYSSSQEMRRKEEVPPPGRPVSHPSLHSQGDGRHIPSPYNTHPPYHGARDAREEAQDLSRDRTRSPADASRGDPREFDPRDPRYERRPHEEVIRKARSPPPAHSHHHRREDQGRDLRLDPHRGMEPRDRSPLGYAGGHERSQPTPPTIRATASPYGIGQGDKQGQGSRGPLGGVPKTIGQPPPLIHSNKEGHHKGPGKEVMASMLHSGPPHPGGSITQGTPVQPGSSGSSMPPRPGVTGSISKGTPRYDHGQRQATPPQSRVDGGSITKGTPITYEGAGRGIPVSHEGAIPRMPGVIEAVRANPHIQMYPEMRMPIQHMYTPALQDIYRHQRAAFYPGNMIPQRQYQPEPHSLSSRATLMDDFRTAQQMQQHTDSLRRAQQDKQLSPRSREALATREVSAGQKGPFPPGVPDGMPHHVPGMVPYPVPGLMYHQVATSAAPVSQTSPHPSTRDMPSPHAPDTSQASTLSQSWPRDTQRHPTSQSGNIERRHATPPPSRQNVIQLGKSGMSEPGLPPRDSYADRERSYDPRHRHPMVMPPKDRVYAERPPMSEREYMDQYQHEKELRVEQEIRERERERREAVDREAAEHEHNLRRLEDKRLEQERMERLVFQMYTYS